MLITIPPPEKELILEPFCKTINCLDENLQLWLFNFGQNRAIFSLIFMYETPSYHQRFSSKLHAYGFQDFTTTHCILPLYTNPPFVDPPRGQFDWPEGAFDTPRGVCEFCVVGPAGLHAYRKKSSPKSCRTERIISVAANWILHLQMFSSSHLISYPEMSEMTRIANKKNNTFSPKLAEWN